MAKEAPTPDPAPAGKPDAVPPKDPDADILAGAPQADPDADVTATPAPAPAPEPTPLKKPELVSINVGGQEFKVPKDQADAYTTQQTEYQRQLAEKPAAALPEPGAKKPDETDYSDLLFTDPNTAIATLRKEIRDEVVGEVTVAYQREKGVDDFWSGFYRDNDDLKGTETLVKAVFNRDYPGLAGLPIKTAADTLAKSVRAEELSILKRHKGTTRRKNATETLESGGIPAKAGEPEKEEEPKEPISISAAIRQRNRDRTKSRPAA